MLKVSCLEDGVDYFYPDEKGSRGALEAMKYYLNGQRFDKTANIELCGHFLVLNHSGKTYATRVR